MSTKRTLLVCLALALVLALAAPAAAAESDFVIDSDGVLTEYVGPGGDVTIPSGVTAIGDGAFYSCTQLTSVSIPNGVTQIGDGAFGCCESLTHITIPGSVKRISDGAFECCESLTQITIPEGVMYIGDFVFSGCPMLTEVSLPNSLVTVGRRTFEGAACLYDLPLSGDFLIMGSVLLVYLGQGGAVTVPDNVTSIGAEAFENCTALTSVILPAGLKGIGDYAFCDCTALTSVTIPDGVKRIGECAFLNCEKLSEMTFPDSLTAIEYRAFERCTALRSIVLPDSLQEIGEMAFYDCDALSGVSFPDSLIRIDACAFQSTGLTEVVIPAGVRELGSQAFSHCEDLETVSILGSPLLAGNYIFNGCPKLREVILPAGERPAVPEISSNSFGGFINAEYCPCNNADPINSILYWDGSAYVRVEMIRGMLIAERYSPTFQLLSSHNAEVDLLAEWGGFFAGETANYTITGRDNLNEDDSVPVVTVTEYDKDWNRQRQVSLYGANTIVPFRAGSVRCTEYNGMLYVHTCHQMYKTPDGLNHQANLTFCVRESDMKVTDARFNISNISTGYVSHSFNQFILIDDAGRIVTLDHGDAYPRSAVLQRYQKKAGADSILEKYGGTNNINIQVFPGAIGDNTTGASVGGLGETDKGYVTAYNYNGVGAKGSGKVMGIATDDPEPVRNVYFSWTDKSVFSSAGTRVTKLTDFRSGGTQSTGTPLLVPMGPDGGYILWEIFDIVPAEYSKNFLYYRTGDVVWAHYDANGVVGEQHTAKGALSDCQPVVVDGKAVWYVTDDSAPVFYTLDENGLTAQNALWQAEDAVKVRANGDLVWWTDAAPFIDANSRTMVPLRAVAEALDLRVDWDGAAREAIFSDGDKTLRFPIDSSQALAGDGRIIQMDTAAVIVNDRTYAPIRYLAEFFGYKVDWDGITRTVILSR